MGKGIDFAGQGMEDVTHSTERTGNPSAGSRASAGPVKMTGNGAADTGGVNDDTMQGRDVPDGGPIQFAGDV